MTYQKYAFLKSNKLSTRYLKLPCDYVNKRSIAVNDKFESREYKSITEFVADMRLMLENCYRYNGATHHISKKAQRLEIILEQKLTLLSRYA